MFVQPGRFNCSQYIRLLGIGSFGSVFECYLQIGVNTTNRTVEQSTPPVLCAIKKMLMFAQNPYEDAEKASTSVIEDVVHKVSMPKIVRSGRYPFEPEPLREIVFAAMLTEPAVTIYHASVSNDGILYAAMDSALHNLMVVGQIRNENELLRTGYQMLKCLAYLHAHGFGHGDVKPSNFLVYDNGTIRLGDLGMSSSVLLRPTRSRTVMFTKEYRPPEFCLPYRYNIFDLMRGDIWACGASLYTLATGAAPLSSERSMGLLTSQSLLTKLCIVMGVPSDEQWPRDGIPETSQAIRQLAITQARSAYNGMKVPPHGDSHAPMWQYYTNKTINTIADKDLRAGIQQLLRRMLECNPARRPTAQACLRERIFTDIHMANLQQQQPNIRPSFTTRLPLETSLIEQGNKWVLVLFDLLQSWADPEPLTVLARADVSVYKHLMTIVAVRLRDLRLELNAAALSLRKARAQARKPLHKRKRIYDKDIESKIEINAIDTSDYPRTGFAEYAESIGVCLHLIARAIARDLKSGRAIAETDGAPEMYALSAFVVYDGTRRYKQYGISKYVNTRLVRGMLNRAQVDHKNRLAAQRWLGRLGLRMMMLLDTDLGRPTPWDVATVFMRHICEAAGADGAPVLCGYAVILLKYLVLAYQNPFILARYNSIEIGSWLAGLSLAEYRNSVPPRGIGILDAVLRRVKNEFPVPAELEHTSLV